MQRELEEGQIVLCTVKKIVGTTVFVKIESYDKEGTMITSEIAPGRIRNLRDYVVPNKKIVCKILRIDKEHIALSLRRVTTKEKKEILEEHKKEKSLAATLKTISKDAEKIIEKVKENSSLAEFFEQAKENPKLLEKLMNKEETEKLLKILKEKREKEISVKKKFSLTCQAEDGIVKIKKILPEEATYLAAGKFLLTIKNNNYKDANMKLTKILQDIEKKAKQENCIFSISKQKQK
jgi:translation initiation factor 2 alpha subunit (eIF-2alpha)